MEANGFGPGPRDCPGERPKPEDAPKPDIGPELIGRADEGKGPLAQRQNTYLCAFPEHRFYGIGRLNIDILSVPLCPAVRNQNLVETCGGLNRNNCK